MCLLARSQEEQIAAIARSKLHDCVCLHPICWPEAAFSSSSSNPIPEHTHTQQLCVRDCCKDAAALLSTAHLSGVRQRAKRTQSSCADSNRALASAFWEGDSSAPKALYSQPASVLLQALLGLHLDEMAK